MRTAALIVCMTALVIGAALDAAAQQAAGTPAILSAQRCKKYSRPNQTVSARDEMADVVVALRIRGLTRDDFLKTDDETVYVMAGEERLPPAFVAAGRIDGEFEVLVVFVGPKAIRDMTLHYGTHPEAKFTADQTIAEELP